MFQVRKLYSHFSRSVSIFERVNILLNFYNRLKYNNTDAIFNTVERTSFSPTRILPGSPFRGVNTEISYAIKSGGDIR